MPSLGGLLALLPWGQNAPVPYIEAIYELTGGPLIPGELGQCLFHSQGPWHQDQWVFQQLGGVVFTETCTEVPSQFMARVEAEPSEERQFCECLAPNATAFNRTFVEVGAFDGKYLSNSIFFEAQLGWRGMCVEASPVVFPKLKEVRPNCINVNTLVGQEAVGTKAIFYTFTSPVDRRPVLGSLLGHGVTRTAEDARDYAMQNKLALQEHRVGFQTLADLFRAYGFTEERIGWISIDVQGQELNALSSIDFMEVQADFISYDGSNPDGDKILTEASYFQDRTFPRIDTMFRRTLPVNRRGPIPQPRGSWGISFPFIALLVLVSIIIVIILRLAKKRRQNLLLTMARMPGGQSLAYKVQKLSQHANPKKADMLL